MSGKFALIIGNTEYTDPGLAQLSAPGKDTEDFARILKSPDICAFDDVNILLNQASFIVGEAIDAFFYQRKPDDLLIVYFSGHGVRDEFGTLYLAVKNTNRTRLRATAIRSDYIREAMDQSRSKRQVVILDCCNSGAFSQGTKAETGGTMGLVSALQGYGRFVLTASDATQFAWEGDQVIGETQNSLFTHFLVKGLEGEADSDGDGKITVDELYDYAYDQISRVTPKQTPTKSASKQEGEIVLRQITRLEQIRPVSLPDELIEATEDSRAFVREAAVQQLEKFLKGKNLGLARSAREALERIEREDDSRRVSQAATKVLISIHQAEKTAAEEERRAREEAELIAAKKAEEKQIALEKAEAEKLLAEQKAVEDRRVKEEAERIAIHKTEEDRLAVEKAETERKAKEEAERLLAEQRAEQERKARAEAERLAALRAEQEHLAQKAEEEQKALEKTEAEKLLAEQKTEEDRLAAAKAKLLAEQLAKERAERLAKQRAEVEQNAREKPTAHANIETQENSQLAEFGRSIRFPRWSLVIFIGLISTLPFYSLLTSFYGFWSLLAPLVCGGLVARISRNKSGANGMFGLAVGGISGIPCLFALIVWIWASGFSFDSSMFIFGALILISAGIGGGLIDYFDSRIQPS